jgi:succinate dehydrogenase / fumarate reductase, cytochrome b subunit
MAAGRRESWSAKPVMIKKRPKYLNLVEIKLPLAGFVSILHRVSGAGLFLMLPLLIYLLQLSLGSPQDFATFKAVVDHPLVKLILIGLSWAFLHHFCMGIRIVLIDMHIGVDLAQARASALFVQVVSLLLTAIVGVKLW